MPTLESDFCELLGLVQSYVRQEYRAGQRLWAGEADWKQFGSEPLPVEPPPQVEVPKAQPRVALPKPQQPPPKPRQQKQQPEKTPEPKAEPKVSGVQRQKLEPIANNQNSEALSLLKTFFPTPIFRDAPPDDTQAQEIANKWQQQKAIPPITILCWHSNAPHMTLLTNIARAITLSIQQAAVVTVEKIEQESGWPAFFQTAHLKWIIAPETLVHSNPELAAMLKREGDRTFLKNTPLFLLPDLEPCLADPTHKISLWNALQKESKMVNWENS